MQPALTFAKARFAWLAALVLPLVIVTHAFAQDADVRVELTGKRVVVKEGKESFVSADKAGPGDVIQYEAVYKNTGKGAAHNLAATVPVPQGMTLQMDSAKPVAEQASLDGKNFSAVPLMRDVPNQSGVLEKQAVPLSEYRALRWNLPELAPDKTVTVTLRARIVTNAPLTP